MEPQEFVDAVRADNRTALSRLGASKALYADTGGDLQDEAVLAAAADRARHAAETFESWAAEESADAAADLFAATAATEREHVATLAEEHGAYDPDAAGDDGPGDVPAVQAHLRGVDETVDRLGAFVGWALTGAENTGQVVGYFVGQASPGTAGTVREVGDDYDTYLADAVDALAQVCEADADWERAKEAAGEAIAADYDDYFETLESLGVNPKPVC